MDGCGEAQSAGGRHLFGDFGLQRTPLTGEDPSLALRALTELAADDSAADDPGLAAILRAIVQRSRIEIARREVSR